MFLIEDSLKDSVIRTQWNSLLSTIGGAQKTFKSLSHRQVEEEDEEPRNQRPLILQRSISDPPQQASSCFQTVPVSSSRAFPARL